MVRDQNPYFYIKILINKFELIGLISSRGRHVVITNNTNYEAGYLAVFNDTILKLFLSSLSPMK